MTVRGLHDAGSSLLSRRVQSRSSALTGALAQALTELAEGASEAIGAAPLVIGSAYGEIAVLEQLLDQWLADAAISPLRFVGSVHNAALGQIAIATAATGFSTSVAAGVDTVAGALFEASGLLAEQPDVEVWVALGDERPPASLAPARASLPSGLVGALRLGRDTRFGRERALASDSTATTGALGWLELLDTAESVVGAEGDAMAVLARWQAAFSATAPSEVRCAAGRRWRVVPASSGAA